MLLGMFCVALALMSGMVQAAHFHVSGQPDHDCALCIAAHSAARAAAPVEVPFTLGPVTQALPARSIATPRRAYFFRLAIRPPPPAAVLFL